MLVTSILSFSHNVFKCVFFSGLLKVSERVKIMEIFVQMTIGNCQVGSSFKQKTDIEN